MGPDVGELASGAHVAGGRRGLDGADADGADGLSRLVEAKLAVPLAAELSLSRRRRPRQPLRDDLRPRGRTRRRAPDTQTSRRGAHRMRQLTRRQKGPRRRPRQTHNAHRSSPRASQHASPQGSGTDGTQPRCLCIPKKRSQSSPTTPGQLLRARSISTTSRGRKSRYALVALLVRCVRADRWASRPQAVTGVAVVGGLTLNGRSWSSPRPANPYVPSGTSFQAPGRSPIGSETTIRASSDSSCRFSRSG